MNLREMLMLQSAGGSGSGEANMVVPIIFDAQTESIYIDATYQEILDAMHSGKSVICVDFSDDEPYGAYQVISIEQYNYTVRVFKETLQEFKASSASGKPTIVLG